MRWQPAIRSLPPYYDHPAYIDALCNSLTGHLGSIDWQPDVVIASFHGLPEDYLTKGDPYHCHCQKTARLMRERLRLAGRQADCNFPVPLRQGRMAQALY